MIDRNPTASSNELPLTNYYQTSCAELLTAVKRLDDWFDTQRLPGGYGGPVSHWWWDCLDYTGPGLDWRYEGIITGYLNLWQYSRQPIWLEKAKRAGNDLVAGQLPSGNYRNSRFEQNPGTCGTPHEAACDLGLLRLAEVLRGLDDGSWEVYFHTAHRNLQEFCIDRLWDPETRSFRDDPAVPGFVPNKSATLAEALFALARLNGEMEWAERYALPALRAVIDHQASGGSLDGAICQNSFGGRRVEKYFPYYVARCIPGLLEGFAWTQDERFAQAAKRAAAFVLRTRYADGSFPQVLYPGGRQNRYPQWVAGVGDILRALDLAAGPGLDYDPGPSLDWLFSNVGPQGAFHTGRGFGRAAPFGNSADRRDSLAVVGWNDKAFHYLTGLLLRHCPQPAQG